MKTVILLRHAKSSWDDTSLSDFERPLTDRGRRDAALMGSVLKRRRVRPDRILSSPANRALTTARLAAPALGYRVEDISVIERLYEAGVTQLLRTVRECDPADGCVVLVGHNPAMHAAARAWAAFDGDKFPTCGVACIDFPTDDWNGVAPGAGTLRFVEFPKRHAPRGSDDA